MHVPVLRDKVAQFLEPLEGKIVLDATVGTGGHAELILNLIGPDGRLVGLDQDAAALEVARHRLSSYFSRMTLVQSNFSQLHDALKQAGVTFVDGIVMDLGLSTLQLEDQGRGFSFNLEGPLDMRMDRQQQLTAREIVNRSYEEELEGLLREYGEERFAKRIAAAIIHHRKKSPIETSAELAAIVEKAVPRKAWPKRIHPATRTFQALRIKVNNELGNLQQGLEQATQHLKPSGKLLVISYHSLEDRIVKKYFKSCAKTGYKQLTKKPVVPDEAEIRENRKARSAKLRVLERVA